jgi:Trypsin-co-occurring domain 2
MGNSDGIGLAQLLGQIRAEIEESRSNLSKSGKEPLMDWESAEIEISFAVKKKGGAGAKAKFLVFAVEAGGEYKSEQIHRLKLQLKPHKGIGVFDPNDPGSVVLAYKPVGRGSKKGDIENIQF